jgi:peptidoglycan/xylan/chitin deacetylase (PgdA/CDA1 family)
MLLSGVAHHNQQRAAGGSNTARCETMNKTITTIVGLCTATALAACGGDNAARSDTTASAQAAAVGAPSASGGDSSTATGGSANAPPASGPTTPLPPNELGRIPILEYHLIEESAKPSQWRRTPAELRQELQYLYDHGYRPVNMVDVLDKNLNLPRGTSPVVFVFDDASPSQFRYIEKNGKLEIDPTSAVGIWADFHRAHPDWSNKAVFCVLSGAEAGRSFFGNKGIEGQKSEWRFKKLQYLRDQGFEICNHTLWHMTMSKYGDGPVQEQIARLALAVDSALPGYKIRTLALPLGEWPKNHALAHRGSWTDPKTGKKIDYKYDAVLLVAGGPARSPYDPQFDPLIAPREQIFGNALKNMVERLDREKARYVSDGDPGTIAKPTGR